MNIKNPETERLVKELAQVTGETQTAAITEAVREKLTRLRDRKGLAERLLALGREAAAHIKEPYLSGDVDELLYDEKGLPK